MVLSLDNQLKTAKIVDGQTLDEFGKEFSRIIDEDVAGVGLASTVNNQQALAIHFNANSPTYNELCETLSKDMVFARIDDFTNRNQAYIIFVPMEKIRFLKDSVKKDSVRFQILDVLSEQIQRQKGRFFLYEFEEKLQALEDLHTIISSAPVGTTVQDYSKRIEDWEKQEWDFKANNNGDKEALHPKTVTTAEIIASHRNIFFAQKRGKNTNSQDAIEMIKDMLKPAAPESKQR